MCESGWLVGAVGVGPGGPLSLTFSHSAASSHTLPTLPHPLTLSYTLSLFRILSLTHSLTNHHPPQGTGEDEDDVEASSATLVQSDEGYAPVFFSPRPLKNLVLVDEMPSLMPLTDMKVANLLGEEIPQIYALMGR